MSWSEYTAARKHQENGKKNTKKNTKKNGKKNGETLCYIQEIVLRYVDA